MKVLIIGGGFGGIAAAQALARGGEPGLTVTLVSDKPHFEYHPGLYRTVTGRSPLEVCVPLREVLSERLINLAIDRINLLDADRKVAYGVSGSRYPFDFAIVAVGSETNYFQIPGLEKFSFGFKSIREALTLKEHFHRSFAEASQPATAPEEKLCLLHTVVVGAGASGVELAGELAFYLKNLACSHRLDPSLITLDLVEAADRILPAFPAAPARRVAARLRSLGVNIFVNRPVLRGEQMGVILRGMQIKTATVIWTSGVSPNPLYAQVAGLKFDTRGRVLVDEYLAAEGAPGLLVIGDGAAAKFWGMAQTAIDQGQAVAYNLLAGLRHRSWRPYVPHQPFHSIPVGRGWAATLIKGWGVYGWPGWILRRLADLRYFFSILPPGKAITAWRAGRVWGLDRHY